MQCGAKSGSKPALGGVNPREPRAETLPWPSAWEGEGKVRGWAHGSPSPEHPCPGPVMAVPGATASGEVTPHPHIFRVKKSGLQIGTSLVRSAGVLQCPAKITVSGSAPFLPIALAGRTRKNASWLSIRETEQQPAEERGAF